MNYKGYTIQRLRDERVEYLSIGESRRISSVEYAYASNPWCLDSWSHNREKAIVFPRRKLANGVARKYDKEVSIVGHSAQEVLFNENYFWPWILA